MSRYDADALTRHVMEFQVSTLLTLTSIVHELNNLPVAVLQRLSCLKQVYVGGASMRAQLQSSFKSKLSDTNVIQIWGMTELCAVRIPIRISNTRGSHSLSRILLSTERSGQSSRGAKFD